ncbi:hypothetical protein AXF42_Ash015579 [Apostasia shenzhenica]|uniref:Uncharacterized protein n=1 Tax=Apostasia shenzhenica TaxID=1088818 RepID=A0A2I0AKK8_9ASPA|nr:hypothetical protein AXF42_Ash015579 [Apostasia shenzhenica]
MAKVARTRRRFSSRQLRSTPYPISQPYYCEAPKHGEVKKTLVLEKKDWEEATCSVCMEFPHNAVLLLCSSHDNGCRPYMCGTSYRHSNCLDQFKKAYTKARRPELDSEVDHLNSLNVSGESGIMELACPLCRGQVKGWTVVAPARKYLNKKKRNCMQDGCSFVGTYKELKRHVKSDHPCMKPREVDPDMEEKWRVLELERDRQDVISTIRSSMPRSVVFGDYVIEMADSDAYSEGEAGDVVGGSRGITRGILYFFLREGARLMRLQRNHDALEGVIAGSGPPIAELSAAAPGYASVGGDESSGVTVDGRENGSLGILRAERQRRRRRRRSRGPESFDVS